MTFARNLRNAALTSFLLGLAACASIPRPEVLTQANEVRRSAAAVEAKTYAPAALALAEKIDREAEAAFDRGDIPGAQILGERALAAYESAQALARVARAEKVRIEAEGKLTTASGELGALDAEQARAAADADALELRVRVVRDAQAIVPSGKTDPERERARLAAARALALQARLLCGAARLLVSGQSPESASKLLPALAEATTALTKLDEKLGPAATAAPIDEATRARAGCLSTLTLIRRAATPVTRAPGVGDALLAELSAAGGLAPSRDDRGVVVTLRGLFRNDALSSAGQSKLAELGKVAGAHPAFPIEVVVHGERAQAGDQKRAETVAKALAASASSAVRVEPIAAGDASPVVDPGGADRARNARVEIVFVTPESF